MKFDDSRQSCQFYYFKWNDSNEDLHKKLKGVNRNDNDLIRIRYSGKPDLLKGIISLSKNSIPYNPSFCFNVKKHALLITGNSLVRDTVARAIVNAIAPAPKIITPLARMKVQDVMDVANKLLDAHPNNKIPYPKFNFGLDRFKDNRTGDVHEIVNNMISRDKCSIRNNKSFQLKFKRCKEIEGQFTFESKIFEYPGIFDDNSGYEKLKLSKHYSFSTYKKHLGVGEWLTFSEHILDKPLYPF